MIVDAASRRISPEDHAYINDRRALGYPDSAIARMIGRPVEAVRAVLVPWSERERAVAPAAVVAAPKAAPLVLPPPAPVEIPVMPDRALMALDMIAGIHGLSREDIVGPSLKIAHIRARHHFMAELRDLGYGYHRISRFSGRSDHTTARNGVALHNRRLAEVVE